MLTPEDYFKKIIQSTPLLTIIDQLKYDVANNLPPEQEVWEKMQELWRKRGKEKPLP